MKTKIIKYCLLFILLISVNKLDAFNDVETKISKMEQYNLAEIVLIGTIIDSLENSYRIKVDEELKGNLPTTTLEIFTNQYNKHMKKGERWLLYINLDASNGEYYINPYCSSRSFDNLVGLNDISFPNPPPHFLKSDAEMFVLNQTNLSKSLNELYYEIQTIRLWRMKEDIKEKLEGDKARNILLNYIIIGLVVVLILLIMVLYVKIKD